MIIRFSSAALALALLAPPSTAQSVAEQMQKAMYHQQTDGDLDAAIQGYRQVINSSPADRKVAAMAQFRLAQALLQKGELQEAAREFQALSNYPEYKSVIASMAGRGENGSRGSVISRGTYNSVNGNGGHYSNKNSGLELTVPPGWTIADSESSDNGDMAMLTDANRNQLQVWMIAEQHPATELAALLRHDLDNKASMRPTGWRIRPDSIQAGGAGDHQYLKAVADYGGNGTKVVELLVWARSTKTHALFFTTGPESALNSLTNSLGQLVSTAVIP